MKIISTKERLYNDIAIEILEVDRFPVLNSFRIVYDKTIKEIKEIKTRYEEEVEIIIGAKLQKDRVSNRVSGFNSSLSVVTGIQFEKSTIIALKEDTNKEVIKINKYQKWCNVQHENIFNLGLRSKDEIINNLELKQIILNNEKELDEQKNIGGKDE